MPEPQAAAVVAQEIGFRDLCAQAIGSGSFAATLRAASQSPEKLDEWVNQAAGWLNLDIALRPAQRDGVDDLLLAIASILRLNRLALSAEKQLRVLALSELALRRLLTLTGNQSVGVGDAATPKGAIEILNRFGIVAHLLSIADEPVFAVKNALKKIPPFGDTEMTFAAFEILRAAEKKQPLTAVFEKTLVQLSVSDRMALLMDLARLIGPAEQSAKAKRFDAKR